MKNTDCGCRYKGPIQILSCPEHNVAAKNLNVAQAMIARLENEIEVLKAGRSAGEIWGICGGEYEPWEVFVRAETAEKAILQYRANCDDMHRENAEAARKKLGADIGARSHSVVDVWSAEINEFGVVELIESVMHDVTD